MNQFRFKIVKIGDIEFFISKTDAFPEEITVPVPYLKPDRSYGSMDISEFDDVVRVIMYKTSNDYVNNLFDYTNWFNIYTKVSEIPIEVNFDYKDNSMCGLLKPHSLYASVASGIGIEFNYSDDQEKIKSGLDSLIG